MKRIPLNDSWLFRKLPGHCLADAPALSLEAFPGETVSLPHTWFQNEDQYRGLCVYEKEIENPADKRLLLSFGAADQNCAVYVNGLLCGTHRGGYSRFRLPVPDEARAERLKLRVFVENQLNEEISPLSGDFTVFGGLTRGAELLCGGESGFDRCYYGTEGLILRAGLREDGSGLLTAEPHTVCAPGARIAYTLCDETGAEVCRTEASADVTAELCVSTPRLWNGRGDSHLYTLVAKLLINGECVDEVSLRTGFRRVELTADRGLLLNGRPYRLKGVAKHQDRAEVFSAVSEADIREDFALIDEIGANAVRLNHYQHPEAAYACCDELGLLVWAEIPMLKMTENEALLDNAEQQLKELILQNIHHPSIFCWGIQNEIAIYKDVPYMHEECRRLHGIVHALDPQRVSAAANLYPLKASSPLNAVTDMVGYNLYFGWYYGEMSGYGPYLDRLHAGRPTLPLGISEYGVDANLALHSGSPRVSDYSEEYQALWHETIYPQFEARPWLWGSFIWNMFDFSSAIRDEGGQRFVNAKGLVTHDRRIRKDAFYYYKAKWSEEPFVRLTGRRYERRAGAETQIKVYTNLPEVRLELNGAPFGSARTENGTALFDSVPLRMGENELCVRAGELTDSMTLWRVETEPDSYRLPDSGAGGAVRNWFLAGDSIERDGYYCINDTAGELLKSADARAILERYVPELVKLLTERDVIPLGLTLKSILSRNAADLNLKALNDELNQVPAED